MLLLLLAAGCDRGGDEVVCDAATVDSVDGDVSFQAGCAHFVGRTTVIGPGDWSVHYEVQGQVLTPVVTGEGTFLGLVLDGSAGVVGEATPVLWKQGYQSWWWSGVTALSPLTWEERVPVAGGDGDGMSAIDETPGTSWWLGLLGREDGASFLVGALSAKTTKFYTAFENDRAVAVWGGRDQSLTVDGELRLDPVWMGADADPWALHTEYAETVAAHHGLVLDEPVPTGWATWTVYYEELTEEAVREDLAALDPALEVVQLDDGWQTAWGDWTPNEHFPGWAELPGDIEAAGHRPGLWMAPFYVEASTQTAQDHPDWFVGDFYGGPISFSNFGSNDYLVLDVTHPDAAAFFQQNLRDRVDEGWTYFKLDFLYAGMQEGYRHEQMTGAQAYDLGMRLIREAIGDDSFFLACGAPMLPTVGYADAYRTGADIAFGFDPDGQPEYLRWQARATAARAWQNGIWWWVDADQIMLREPVDPTGALVAGLVSGGAWLYGDKPADMDPRFVDDALLSLAGQTAVPENPLGFVSGPDFGPVAELGNPDDSVPTRWVFPDGTVALLNLSDSSVTVEGPGGTELLSGEQAGAEARTLFPGTAELWR